MFNMDDISDVWTGGTDSPVLVSEGRADRGGHGPAQHHRSRRKHQQHSKSPSDEDKPLIAGSESLFVTGSASDLRFAGTTHS